MIEPPKLPEGPYRSISTYNIPGGYWEINGPGYHEGSLSEENSKRKCAQLNAAFLLGYALGLTTEW